MKPNLILILLSLLTILYASTALAEDQRYFEFTMRANDENFIAATSENAVIQSIAQQLALPEANRNLHINGTISVGNAGYNNCWSWHFDPNQWTLAEMSIELCDGRPSFIDDDLSYWLNTVKSFCPWGSYVLREVTIEKDLDLSDAIVALKVAAQEDLAAPCTWADTKGDSKLGLEEAISTLQIVAGLKP